MRVAGLSFNLMTLGGIAAAIGLVIDDAIVVVEAIYAKVAAGLPRLEAVHAAIGEIFRPLVGSTLTPVVVFIPLAFLDGITGVFFRALAMTMVVSLLTSLVLAMTLTPSLAAWFIRDRGRSRSTATSPSADEGGFILRRIIRLYEIAVRIGAAAPVAHLARLRRRARRRNSSYGNLESDFLPRWTKAASSSTTTRPMGTSLAETNRQLLQAEEILRATPEVESYSRRTGARLALAIAEPNTGDFLVKLKPDRTRPRRTSLPSCARSSMSPCRASQWEFPGILTDLIGDLTWLAGADRGEDLLHRCGAAEKDSAARSPSNSSRSRASSTSSTGSSSPVPR